MIVAGNLLASIDLAIAPYPEDHTGVDVVGRSGSSFEWMFGQLRSTGICP
jgi:hypothetical protein